MSFDLNTPSDYLCSLYRVQHRYRKGDNFVADILSERTAQSPRPVNPTLRAVLQSTWFIINPTAGSAINLLETLVDDDVLINFLTPHWAYRAGITVAQGCPKGSTQLLEAYGNASAILARSAQKWPSVSILTKTLKEYLTRSFSQRET